MDLVVVAEAVQGEVPQALHEVHFVLLHEAEQPVEFIDEVEGFREANTGFVG
jgi:hypothetical protein